MRRLTDSPQTAKATQTGIYLLAQASGAFAVLIAHCLSLLAWLRPRAVHVQCMSRPSRGLVFKLASGLLLCVLGLLLLRLLIVGSVACTPPGHASLAASQHGGGDPIHIVYSLCGGDSKLEDLLVSLTSLYVMAQNDSAVYDVHVISDGSVGAQHFTRFARR